MIARIWHGRVPMEKYQEYRDHMVEHALPDYRSTEGNLSAQCLHRMDGNIVHFVTLTKWESMEAIRRFAGDPVDKAKYYDFDSDYLIELEPRVEHYEISE